MFYEKIICILLCSALQAFADNLSKCPEALLFEVSIKNNTSSSCTVIQQTVRRGYLEKNYATTILSQDEQPVISIRDFTFQGSDVVLSYQCGDNQFATIESEHNIWAMNQNDIKGWIWSLTGIDASYETQRSSCDQPTKIVWTLSGN